MFEGFSEWLKTATTLDLIEAETAVREQRERKKAEGRIPLIRVAVDGINVAHFRNDDMESALAYLVKFQDNEYGEVRIERVRIIESEVQGLLYARWW